MAEPKSDRIAKLGTSMALSALGLDSAAAAVVTAAKVIFGDNDAAFAAALEEDRAELLEDLRRRVEAIEATLRASGKEPSTAAGLNRVELGRQVLEAFPRLFGAEARAAVANAVARRAVYPADADRSLLEHWWQVLQSLGEADIRLVYLLGDGRASLSGNTLRVERPLSGPTMRSLRDDESIVLVEIYQKHYKELFDSKDGWWILSKRGVALWNLIRDP